MCYALLSVGAGSGPAEPSFILALSFFDAVLLRSLPNSWYFMLYHLFLPVTAFLGKNLSPDDGKSYLKEFSLQMNDFP